MSSSVIASNIPSSVPVDKVHHFFSFCGSVDSVTPKTEGEKVSSYTVKFADPKAVSSALLLNGAELEGSPIQITTVEGSASIAGTAAGGVAAGISQLKTAVVSGITPESSTAAAVANQPIIDTKSSAPSTAAAAHTDIAQEEKPKSTIFAEYLAHGYVLGDNILQKAVEVDQKHGFSSSFKKFVSDLDSKYHVQQKADEANKKYGIDEKLETGKRSLDSYFNKAQQTETGSKIHSFYTDMVTNAKQIHEEAKRLAQLKKQNNEAKSSQ